MVEALRKLVWVYEFWNEMLVSNVKCKNLLKRSGFRKFLLDFWEERGEKLMTCHLFLDNFSWNFMTFGLFSKVKSFWNGFLFQENVKYHNFEIMNFIFLNLVFRKRRVIAEIWSCFRACNSWIVTYDQEFCLVVWFCVLITVTESFWKVPFKEIMVLSKTCVRFQNRIFKKFEYVLIKSFLSH
jgi:hypothetical protein